jgi:hypothetical protein
MNRPMDPGSVRYRAWRNLMVSAINAALEAGKMSLAPGDNRWTEDDGPPAFGTHVFQFTIEGAPAMCSLHDSGWDEINVHACYLPTADGAKWVGCGTAGFLAGEAFAEGWLERRAGAYLQTSPTRFKCRNHVKPALAAINVSPIGYRDRGKLILYWPGWGDHG